MTTRTKITELPPLSELTIDDIFPVSDDPSGSPISKKASIQTIYDLFEKGYFAREVDNVTDLASEEAGTGYVCVVRDLDRGGIFKAVNSGTVNDGTIFASATSGWTWQRIYSNYVNVKWFGAVGDGVTNASADDTEALQAAIDWAEGASNFNGGGEFNTIGKKAPVLFFPPAVYVTESLDIKDGVKLLGTHGSMLRLKAGTNDSLLKFANVNGWSIDTLILDGNRDNNTSGHGIYTNYSESTKRVIMGNLANLFIQNFAQDGINFDDGISINILNGFNLTIKYCGRGGITWSKLNDSKWVNTDISWCDEYGIDYAAKNNQIFNTKVWLCRVEPDEAVSSTRVIPVAATEALDNAAVRLEGERNDFVGLQVQENASIGLRIGSSTRGFNLSSITNLLVDGNGGYDSTADSGTQSDYRRDGMQIINYYKTKISGVCDDFRAQRGYGRQKRGIKSIGTIPTFSSGTLQHSDWFKITDNSGGFDCTNLQLGIASPSNAVGTIFQCRTTDGSNGTPTDWGTGEVTAVNDLADIELVIANQYEQDQGTGDGYDITTDGGNSFIRINGNMISTPNRIQTTKTLNFGSIAAGAISTITSTVTGAEVGNNLVINPRSTLLNGFTIESCRVSAADTIEAKMKNGTLTTQSISQSFDITVLKS